MNRRLVPLHSDRAASLRQSFRAKLLSAFACLGVWLTGCAADLHVPVNTTAVTTTGGSTANTAGSTKIRFQYSDFYSLVEPQAQTQCAGDQRTFYSAFDLALPGAATLSSLGSTAATYVGPQAYASVSGSRGTPATEVTFATDPNNSAQTQRPPFILNVSVDLTDANSTAAANLAHSCSLGNGASVPPVSNCATFDYGAIGGIPTTLGGTLLLVGGITTRNFAGNASVSCGPALPATLLTSTVGSTSCGSSMYALGVDVLPPSAVVESRTNPLAPGLSTPPTESISTWANLSSGSSYVGPRGAAASSIAYDAGLQRIILYGGSSPISAFDAHGPACDTAELWSYDLKSQTWTSFATTYVPDATTGHPDIDDTQSTPVVYNFSLTPSGRANFGYAAIPYLGISGMQTAALTSAATDPTATTTDTTDRILIVGGRNSNGISTHTYRFNPTFGPEWVNAWDPLDAQYPDIPKQWMASYPIQILDNTRTPGSQFRPVYPIPTPTPSPTNTPSYALNFGLSPIELPDGNGGTMGGAISAGGFDVNFPKAATPTPGAARIYFTDRPYSPAAPTPAPSGAYRAVVADDLLGHNIGPIAWNPVLDNTLGGPQQVTVGWYGGVSMLPGLNLTTNDVVYFGGTSCRDYLNDGTLSAANCDFNNPGSYVRLHANGFPNATGSSSSVIPWTAGTVPKKAGMATARGLDCGGNPIIVAWGGMSSPTVTANSNQLSILYNATPGAATPAPTWTTLTPAAGSRPVEMGDATMVFSHVTGKFYLFGGYQTSGVLQTSGDTWELAVTGTYGSTPNSCTYTWKQLNGTAGALTCLPASCPPARRSHRMVEINYNLSTSTRNAVTHEPKCTDSAHPCSFGIFMEGGTPDGSQLLSDRWMFDPTANGGNGHWQLVNTFPPRHQAAMASASYTVFTVNTQASRMVLFGGETGMQNPTLAGTSAGMTQYFVPPTLGDTNIYDLSGKTWSTANLLGKGYNPDSTIFGGGDSFDRREAYPIPRGVPPANYDEISALSPPPLSGSVMISRTLTKSSSAAPGVPVTLKIPETFLFGGRLKDGSYHPLSQVYKFCIGTTGEKPAGADGTAPDNDALCDAYDLDSNSGSTTPVDQSVGRWLRKTPTATTHGLETFTIPRPVPIDPSNIHSYLGAGAYDSDEDKLLLVGGLSSASSITDPVRTVSNVVYQYSPPTKTLITAGDTLQALRNGYWESMPACTDAAGSEIPQGRYGHSMGYDALNRQLIVTGGYDVNGAALTQSVSYSGGSYTIPEVWTGRRVAAAGVIADLGANILDTPANTFPCYYWRRKTIFGNNPAITTQVPPTSGLAHAAAVFVPATGYNTGYYSMFDNSCANAGPILDGDPSVNKLLAGGAYIDLDRSQLAAGDNLLMNLTYLPLGITNQHPDGARFTAAESAQFKIHLVKTGRDLSFILAALQPRYYSYSDTHQFPQIVQTLSVLAPPTGEVRQEQIVLPISMDPGIDRIRIERYSGSAILIDATVFRLRAKK